ncbi:MAG TPA: DNA repair protein RecO [Clostridia bacterium]|nr:DNA repair protein RecO [Clostridia bacterium]
MPENFKATAICTRVVDYRENDRLLELCSLEYGKLTAVARGAKKATAKLKFATTPFCFGEYMLAGSNGKYIVCDCTEIESFSNISEDLDSYYIGFAMLELLSKTQINGHANSDAMLAVVRSLKSICFDGVKPYAAFNECILAVLNALGYNLDFSTCSSCGCMLDGEGVFTEADGVLCAHCGERFGIKIPQNTMKCLQNPLECDENSARATNILLRDIVYLILNVKINSLNTAI